MRKILLGIKIFIKAGLLCLIAAGVILYCSAALRIKKLELPNDTSNKVAGFYALEENSLDVLFLGTSHSYYAFNPGVFYERTGLNSYVFAGECQPIGVTYHYFIEALKTQKPKVVVLDLFSLLPSSQGCQTSGIIQKNLEDLKMSRNKFKALDLLEDPEERFNAKFDLMLYRNRWSSIEEEEWLYPLSRHFNAQFGFTSGWPGSNEVFERPAYYTSDQQRPIESQLSYLEYIVSLAEENEIELILFKTPFYEELEDFKTMNMLAEFAYLHNVPILDMNLDYEQYDFRFDEDGDVWHCNVRGAIKVTNVLAEYINENLNVEPVHPELYREDYQDLYFSTLQTFYWTLKDLKQFSKFIDYTDLTLIVSYPGFDRTVVNDKNQQLLYDLGIELNFKTESDLKYVSVISHRQILDSIKSQDEIEYAGSWLDHYIFINTSFEQHTSVDDKEMTADQKGINVVVIDNFTKRVVGAFCIKTVDEFEIAY